jgi:mannose/cellobiose epimerase-like protein (N-acyl-D-glucosamine 2-epimerase family)
VAGFPETDRLHAAIERVLRFYRPSCVDTNHGGSIAQFDEETGDIYDGRSERLVATRGGLANCSTGHRLLERDWCQSACEHGLQCLLEQHRDAAQGVPLDP